MANVNWETGEQCQNILGNKDKINKNGFRDQKAGNKFESNLENTGTQASMGGLHYCSVRMRQSNFFDLKRNYT